MFSLPTCVHFKCCCIQTWTHSRPTVSSATSLGRASPPSQGGRRYSQRGLRLLVLLSFTLSCTPTVGSGGWRELRAGQPDIQQVRWCPSWTTPFPPFPSVGLVPDHLASQSGMRGSGTSSAVWSNSTSLSAQTHLCPAATGAVEGLCRSGSPVLPSASSCPHLYELIIPQLKRWAWSRWTWKMGQPRPLLGIL